MGLKEHFKIYSQCKWGWWQRCEYFAIEKKERSNKEKNKMRLLKIELYTWWYWGKLNKTNSINNKNNVGKNEDPVVKSVYLKTVNGCKKWNIWSTMLWGEICLGWHEDNMIMPGNHTKSY